MKIAICFHLGYLHRWREFTPYIDNVMRYCPNTDLYITYREDQDPTEMCRRKYPRAIVMKANRGADTGAFLLHLKCLLASPVHYDYVFKIHTKSGNAECPTWVNDLLQGIAGDVHKISRVFQIFHQQPKVGMICGKRWLVERKMAHDANFPYLDAICRRCHLSSQGIQFVGGTIFWVRMSVLQQAFSNANLENEYQRCEDGKPNEPSITHSWERIYGLVVHHCGFHIEGV
jgi:lipopolysaccharide biosynthesis protein